VRLTGLIFVIGMLFGGLMVGLVMIGLMVPSLIQAQGEDGGLGILPTGIRSLFGNAVTRPLQEAGQEIEDDKIGDFYRSLLETCGLDDDADEVTGQGPESPEGEGQPAGEE